MRKQLVICAFAISLLLVYNMLVFSEVIVPENIQAQIQEKAKEKYPDDYEMQQYVVESQTEAYQKMNSYAPPDIPQETLAQIIAGATEKYPTDYELQLYTATNQVESYQQVQEYSSSNIPPEILEEIIQAAKEKYPKDYELQLYTMSNQSEAYQEAQNYAPQDVPQEIMHVIRTQVIEKYPKDYEMQIYTMTSQVEAYQKILSYTPQEFPQDVLSTVIQKAQEKYPHDYEMQIYTIDNQVEAYKELHPKQESDSNGISVDAVLYGVKESLPNILDDQTTDGIPIQIFSDEYNEIMVELTGKRQNLSLIEINVLLSESADESSDIQRLITASQILRNIFSTSSEILEWYDSLVEKGLQQKKILSKVKDIKTEKGKEIAVSVVKARNGYIVGIEIQRVSDL